MTSSQYFNDDLDDSIEAHLIDLVSDVQQDKRRARSPSLQSNDDDLFGTATMDLVSEDSYHPAEDDPVLALPIPAPQPQLSQHYSQRSKPSNLQKTVWVEVPILNSSVAPLAVPRLSPPAPNVTRRISPRAGKKHRRGFSDTTETPFDLRRSPTRAVAAERRGDKAQTRKPGISSLRLAPAGLKRLKRLFKRYPLLYKGLLTAHTVTSVPQPVPARSEDQQARGRGRSKRVITAPIRPVGEEQALDEEDQPPLRARPLARTQRGRPPHENIDIEADEDVTSEEPQTVQQGVSELTARVLRRVQISGVRATEHGQQTIRHSSEEIQRTHTTSSRVRKIAHSRGPASCLPSPSVSSSTNSRGGWKHQKRPSQSSEVILSSPVRPSAQESTLSFRPSPEVRRRPHPFRGNRHTQGTAQSKAPRLTRDGQHANEISPTRRHARAQRGRLVTQQMEVSRPAAYRSQYHHVEEHSLGAMEVMCEHCGAFLFQGETSSRCCGNGQYRPAPQEHPPEYLHLLLNQDTGQEESQKDHRDASDPVHFRANMRAYNLAFQFTSISCQEDQRSWRGRDHSWYQIHGQIFHVQGQLQAADRDKALWAQLYFYDPDHAAQRRMQNAVTVTTEFKPRASIMKGLHQMMVEYNELVKVYVSAQQMLQTVGSDVTARHHVKVGLDMKLVLDSDQDQRRFNKPTVNESVAAFLPDIYLDDAALFDNAGQLAQQGKKGLSLILRLRSPLPGQVAFEFIRHGHPAYMPLAYPLLFPYGKKTEYSMDDRRRGKNGEQTDKSAQAMHHYSSRLHAREGEFNTVLRGRRVLQQYVVDAWVAVETFRLDFIRYNQDKIRADTYQSIADQNARDVVDPGKVGSRVILPATARNSDRWMQQRYLDSMAIVGYYGKPTFFITFTANPLWDEVTDPLKALESGLKWIDGPPQVARVFQLKLQALLQDLKEAFGHQVGIVRTIEYQKRGVPHCHILLFIEDGVRIFSDPALVDQVISAEIPDREEDPELYAVVTGQLMHGPCGEANPKMSCMKEGQDGKLRCTKGYPKEFRDETIMREDSYPDYRRPDNGRVVIKGAIPLSNRHVVPYSPFLARRYKAHINVEILADVGAVKYIHKYVYKGVDKATMALKDGSSLALDEDEIKQYVSGRWVGACQACWELFSFKVHEEKPAVVRLAVHLPDQQSVVFNEDNTHDWESVLERNAITTLTGWFKVNKEDPSAREIPYVRFPNHYVWNIRTKRWTRRQRMFSIGRLQHLMPQHADLYSLFVLLSSDSCKGATSFEDLRTVDQQLFPTFRLAAQAQGLLPDGNEWRVFFNHVRHWVLGPRLRSLLVLAITIDGFTDVNLLWEEFAEAFCDDLRRRLLHVPHLPLNPDRHLDYGLYLLEMELRENEGGKTLSDFGMPLPQLDWGTLMGYHGGRDTIYNPEQQETLFQQLLPQMNSGQRAAFDTITARIADTPQDCIFFVQGPGGTGKSFLWKCLCACYRSQGKVVLCVASSGIAALVLPGGRTAHSTFKIPLDTSSVKPGGVKAQSLQAEMLRKTFLIIWDEVPMQHRYNIHSVDHLLKDLLGSTKFFGGIPVVFGGDFAQIPPVVSKGRRADQVRASLRSDKGFQKIKQLFLWENMRLSCGEDDQAYAQWLRDLPYTSSLYGLIQLPAMIRQVLKMEELHARVFPLQELSRPDQATAWFEQRAILAPHNRTVDEHNRVLLEHLPGQVQQFDAISSIQKGASAALAQFYSPAFLNTVKSNALQPGILRLKIGAPVILLRNLCPAEGLCNGTRLRVINFQPKAIVATILGGDFDGDVVGIPRIDLNSNPDELPFVVTRRQFPVRLCFAMSINKSQGQSLSCVGVDLRQSTFTHGQLYVALSRVREVSQLTVLLRGDEEARTYKKAENIVWPELLLLQPAIPSI